MFKKLSYGLFASLCILISLYPLTYFLIDRRFGLLQFKSTELLHDVLWNICFYGHIIPGGIALGVGWLQFNKSLRNRKLSLHRTIGKIYITCVAISGLCGAYIGWFATGGWISSVGFISLDVIWLTSTLLGFRAIKGGKVDMHERLMIYSYAACFGAVTLRIWLPILMGTFGDFVEAYRIVSWLSWVPNIVVAYFIVSNKKRKMVTV